VTPEEYAGKYLHLTAVLYDGTVKEVAIQKYLNTGEAWNNPDAAKARPKAAVAEYFRLLGKLNKELPGKKVPKQFILDGWSFDRESLQRCYSGKGSPAEIMDALWLANRCALLDASNVQDYCDSFLGLDCNGFCGNFVGEHRPVGAYDENPRKDFATIATGDLIVFYNGVRNRTGKHIAAVGRLFELKGDKLRCNVVDSGGPELGVKIREKTLDLKKDKAGTVYYAAGDRTAYIVAGPPKKGPNPWARFRAPGTLGEVIKAIRDLRTVAVAVPSTAAGWPVGA
jgi:hypothetical protein